MKIGYGSDLGIKGLRNLGIEGILSVLIDLFYPLIPQSLNLEHFGSGAQQRSGPRGPGFGSPQRGDEDGNFYQQCIGFRFQVSGVSN